VLPVFDDLVVRFKQYGDPEELGVVPGRRAPE
jgi:hypothetical protein